MSGFWMSGDGKGIDVVGEMEVEEGRGQING